jgi:hypothetical protein
MLEIQKKKGKLFRMMYLDDEAKFFRAALMSEMTDRGRGIQAELSRLTGITPSIICDLKFGRTGTSQKNRQALANPDIS